MFQGNNIGRNETVQNGEARTKHPLSTYADDDKRLLVTTVVKEQSRDTGFLLRLKQRWDKQFPEKNYISKQNLGDNATGFKKELEINVGSEEAQTEIE